MVGTETCCPRPTRGRLMPEPEALLQAHGDMVWRTVYRMLGDRDDAHDCYQDTFLDALRVAQSKPVTHWPALLRKIATRRALDRLRERYAKPAPEALGAVPMPDPSAHEPSSSLESAEMLAQARALLAELPPRQAEAFWLRHMEQLGARPDCQADGRFPRQRPPTRPPRRRSVAQPPVHHPAPRPVRPGAQWGAAMNPNHSDQAGKPDRLPPLDPALTKAVGHIADAFDAQPLPPRPDDKRVAAALQQKLADLSAEASAPSSSHNHTPVTPASSGPEPADTRGRGVFPFPLNRRFVMRVVTPLAAAAAIAVAAIVLLNPFGPDKLAFAEVAGRLQAVESASWKMTIATDEQKIKAVGWAVEPSLFRQEMELPTGPVIQVIDFSQERMLNLIPEQKIALQASLAGLPEAGAPKSVLAELKKLDEQHTTLIGEEQHEGKTVLRYDFHREPVSGYILVDPETELPVVSVMRIPTLDPEKPTQVTMYDFVWDPEIDRAMFDLAVPEGYSTLGQMNLDNPSGSDMVEMLRLWTHFSNGDFPGDLQVWTLGEAFGPLMTGEHLDVDTDEQREAIMQQRLADYLQIDIAQVREVDETDDRDLALKLFAPVTNTMSRGGAFLGILLESGEYMYLGRGRPPGRSRQTGVLVQSPRRRAVHRHLR